MSRANGRTGETPAGPDASGAGGLPPPVNGKGEVNEAVSGIAGHLIVKKHTFEGHIVRTVTRVDEPWFVAADVCRALNLQANKGSFGHHLSKLDADEKVQVGEVAVSQPGDTPTYLMGVGEGGGAQGGEGTLASSTDEPGLEPGPDAWLVSEAGLSILILRSRAATTPGTAAHRFRRWVTHEVLPAIRKTGHYGGPRITYGSFEPDNTLPGRYVSLVGRDGKWHHYYSPYATVRNDMDAEDARTLAHGIKVIEGFWRKLQPLHGDQPDLLEAFAWHALGREIRSAAENADQLLAIHERRRLRKPDA